MRLPGRPCRTPLFSPHCIWQALQVADLTIGVMDGYARAYNWQPTIIQAVQPRPSNQAFLDQLDRTAPEPVYRSDGLQLVSEGDLMTVCLTICPSAMPRRKLALICCG